MINKEPLTAEEMQVLLEISDKVVYLENLSLEKEASDKEVHDDKIADR